MPILVFYVSGADSCRSNGRKMQRDDWKCTILLERADRAKETAVREPSILRVLKGGRSGAARQTAPPSLESSQTVSDGYDAFRRVSAPLPRIVFLPSVMR